MTVLADCFFVHLIAPKNHSVSTFVINITNREQDPFAYIITKHYTLKEFYSVIINIGASKKFTVNYRQYFIYKTTTNDNMDINIM